MDKSKFTRKSPGELVRIDRQGSHDWAFVPRELPAEWKFPETLWPSLMEAREKLAALNATADAFGDHNLLLTPLQSREAIASSNMEGTSVTPEEMLAYELYPHAAPSLSDKSSEWQEVSNYGKAMREGCRTLEGQPFSNARIRGMHGILLDGVRGHGKGPGRYRARQVQIGSQGRFIPPPASEVPRLMENLSNYFNLPPSKDGLDPLVKAFVAHYQFEAIHPFEDGNGRVGRVLLALSIYKWLGHVKPWLYLSAYFERFRDEYTDLMFQVSTQGDWMTWIEFCLRATIEQARDSLERCRRFKRLREDFHQRITKPSARTHPIVESLFQHPMLTTTSLSKQLGVAYHTAQSDIQKLVDCGILKLIVDSRPAMFVSGEVMEIAYRNHFSDNPSG